jgi:hypothetical protein
MCYYACMDRFVKFEPHVCGRAPWPLYPGASAHIDEHIWGGLLNMSTFVCLKVSNKIFRIQCFAGITF